MSLYNISYFQIKSTYWKFISLSDLIRRTLMRQFNFFKLNDNFFNHCWNQTIFKKILYNNNVFSDFRTESWEWGWLLCNLWVSSDVCLCTASILSLCAISIDRYLSITQPLGYWKKHRSKGLASLMILIVWLVSIVITCPPMFGWWVSFVIFFFHIENLFL